MYICTCVCIYIYIDAYIYIYIYIHLSHVHHVVTILSIVASTCHPLPVSPVLSFGQAVTPDAKRAQAGAWPLKHATHWDCTEEDGDFLRTPKIMDGLPFLKRT